MKYLIFFLITKNIYAQIIYERDIPTDMIESQRSYSTENIFNMIKNVKPSSMCNVQIEFGRTYFAIIKNGNSFAFSNKIWHEENRHLTRYECILQKNKKKLICEKKVPGVRQYQSFRTYLKLTINLDDNGIATSMHGVETKVSRLLPRVFDLDKEILEEFTCEFKIPEPIVKDSAVNNKKIGNGRLGKVNKLDLDISASENRSKTIKR